MAITPLDRFGAPTSYRPVADIRRDQPAAAPRAVDAATTDPRPVGPVEARTAAEPPAIESLTSSARAATIALAAAPRETVTTLVAAQDAAAAVEDAALAALADPFEPPTAREVAQNFAAVAALVPSPQRLVNASAASELDADRNVASAGPAANDRELPGQFSLAGDSVGARLSRFA